MGIAKLKIGFFEVFSVGGVFEALWPWDSIATVLTYLYIAFCVSVGFILQLTLQKKCRRPAARWFLIGLCGIGVAVSDYLWQHTDGYGLLGVQLLYGSILFLLLGAAAAKIVSRFNIRKI